MKKIIPSSIKHYTSLKAVLSMLNPECENIAEGSFCFQLRRLDNVNDKEEYRFLKDDITQYGGKKKTYLRKFEELEEMNGMPVFGSFSAMNRNEKNEIPFWNSYVKKRGVHGVCLQLDYKKVKNYCKLNGLYFEPCCYLNKTECREKSREIRNKIKNENFSVQSIIETLKECVLTKNKEWAYEAEYRIFTFKKYLPHYAGDSGYVEYFNIYLPLNCLERIIISPFEEKKILTKF